MRRAGGRCRTDDGWEVDTRSGRNRTGLDAVAWASEAAKRGAGEVLLTSWDRDGTGSGYDLGLLRAVRAALSIPVIASGGGRTPSHLAATVAAGADALLAASIFHDRETTVEQLKTSLRDEQGMESEDLIVPSIDIQGGSTVQLVGGVRSARRRRPARSGGHPGTRGNFGGHRPRRGHGSGKQSRSHRGACRSPPCAGGWEHPITRHSTTVAGSRSRVNHPRNSGNS